MEDGDQGDEGEEHDELEDEGSFGEVESEFDLRGGVGRIGGVGGAVAGDDSDDEVERDEGRPDSARVHGGEVGEVVEESAEDEVEGTRVDWRGYEEHHRGRDEYGEIVFGVGICVEWVVRAIFAEAKPCHE